MKITVETDNINLLIHTLRHLNETIGKECREHNKKFERTIKDNVLTIEIDDTIWSEEFDENHS